MSAREREDLLWLNDRLCSGHSLTPTESGRLAVLLEVSRREWEASKASGKPPSFLLGGDYGDL